MAFPLLIFVAAAAVVWIWRKVRAARLPSLGLPVVGRPEDPDHAQSVIDGYKKYPDTPFLVPSNPPRVILPMRLYDEVVKAPEELFSFNAEIYNSFAGRSTHVGQSLKELTLTIRHDLTKSLPNVLSLLQEEAEFAFKKELGRPKEWENVAIYPKLLRLVAYLSGRIFVGLPIAHDEEWLQMSINYTVHLGEVSRELAKIPFYLRPIISPFISSVRKVRKDSKQAEKRMQPLVSDLMAQNADAEKTSFAKAGSRGSFIQWLLKNFPPEERNSKIIGRCQMQASFAAIHTTSLTSAHVLLDLAARPEHIQPLREELESVLEEDGEAVDENGRLYINKASIAKLKKLDSFIKESQRMNPLSFTSISRQVMSDHTFSSGLKLPKGTHIGFPMWGIYQSNNSPIFGYELNEKTENRGIEEFDGFRFARLRSLPNYESKYQSVTTGAESHNFGHGRHACPGRFFAIYEIKILIIEFLRHYDIRIPGVEYGQSGDRPQNRSSDLANNLDFSATLDIRERK